MALPTDSFLQCTHPHLDVYLIASIDQRVVSPNISPVIETTRPQTSLCPTLTIPNRHNCAPECPVAPISMAVQDYKEISAIAQQRRANSLPTELLLPNGLLSKLPSDVTQFPRESRLFTHAEIEIVESEAEDILQKIAEQVPQLHLGVDYYKPTFSDMVSCRSYSGFL